MEILRIFDILFQSDISIIKECNTLKPVWYKFVDHYEFGIPDPALRGKRNILKSDVCLMRNLLKLQHLLLNISQSDLVSLVYRFVSRGFQNVQITCLLMFVVQRILFLLSNSVVRNYLSQNVNRTVYRSCQYLRLNSRGFDISTYRLWYAMLMTMRGDYQLSLDVLNTMLSSIPPFALYCRSSYEHLVSNETTNWYVDVFSRDDKNEATRARQAWMFDIRLLSTDLDTVPVAIQIELAHCDKDIGVKLSPFVCAYYLMFLNYNALHQYENRDRSLRQLKLSTTQNNVESLDIIPTTSPDIVCCVWDCMNKHEICSSNRINSHLIFHITISTLLGSTCNAYHFDASCTN